MKVTIVGAGLAGLATAYRLRQSGIEAQLLEASAFAGGRIQPAIPDSHQDLGPTWVWPYAQPVVTQWINELGLKLFDQFDSGLGLIDRSPNEHAQCQNLPSQYGIARIEGGTYSLIKSLLKELNEQVLYEARVTVCSRINNQWHLQVSTSSEKPQTIVTDKLIISTPPRLAAALVTSDNNNLIDATNVLRNTETWMAPHAKIVVLYESAFWRGAGLSGRVASQVGPMVEVHDHSGPVGTPAALFGFSGVPAEARQADQTLFIEAIKQQLKRCFGENAPEPSDIIIKDWAFEPYTTTDADRNGNGAHPQVLPDVVRVSHCQHSLWFGASETSQLSPGLIEGALARADEIASELGQGNG